MWIDLRYIPQMPFVFNSKTFKDHFCCKSPLTSIAWERFSILKQRGLAGANLAVEALEALHPNTWARCNRTPWRPFFWKQPLIHPGNLMHGEAENDWMVVLSNSFLCFWVSVSNFRLQRCRYRKILINRVQTMTSKPWIGWRKVEVL